MVYMNDKEIRDKAARMIKETIQKAESSSDLSYATGLIEMAFELGVITVKEKRLYIAALYNKKL